MSISLQECFSCQDSDEELCSYLIESGFKKFRGGVAGAFSHAYASDDTFINIQRNDGTSMPRGVPHDYCFILELNKPLPEFEEGHPLFTFFSRLTQPCAHGLGEFSPPQYGIENYIA